MSGTSNQKIANVLSFADYSDIQTKIVVAKTSVLSFILMQVVGSERCDGKLKQSRLL